jgi:hypothetical protein
VRAMKRQRPSSIRLTAKITAIAAAAALALTGGLAVQMAQGDDPALSAKASNSTSTTSKSSSGSTSSSTGSSVGQSNSDQATSSPATVTTRTS